MKKIEHQVALRIFLVGLFLLGLMTFIQGRALEKFDGGKNLIAARTLAQAASDAVGQSLEAEIEKLELLAAMPTIRKALKQSNGPIADGKEPPDPEPGAGYALEPNSPVVRLYLEKAAALFPALPPQSSNGERSLYLIDGRGRLVAANAPPHRLSYTGVAGWQDLRDLKLLFALNNTENSAANASPALSLFVPVHDEEGFAGALELRLPLQHLLTRASRTFQGLEAGDLSLIRLHQNVSTLVRSGPGSTEIPSEILPLLAEAEANVVQGTDSETDALYAFAPVVLGGKGGNLPVHSAAAERWFTLLSNPLPKDAALWSRTREMIFATGLLLILGLSGAALIIGSRLAAPLNTLVARVKKAARGDFATPVKVKGSGQIHSLTDAFNDMLTRLKHTTISRDELAREVKQRAWIEEELRASRERFREAQRVALMASFEWDLEKGRIRWSEGARDVLEGLPEKDTEEAFLDAVHPEDRPKVERALARALASESKGFEVDFRLQIDQGLGLDQSVHGQGKVFRNEGGDSVRMIGSLQDISRRKLAEDALQGALTRTRRLAGTLKEKNRELEKAHEELKNAQVQLLQREKMASIGQLAAGVAHEINNPIGYIASNLNSLGKFVDALIRVIDLQNEALANSASSEDREKIAKLWKKEKLDFVMEDIRELIDESVDGTDRVSQIVRDLKSFSRVDQSEKSLVDLRDCLESTLNIAWNELKYKTTLEKEFEEIPPTRCYPQQLNQVFLNLLVNAAQAIEEKGSIRLRTWHDKERIFVSVSDTGKGIREEELGQIFEPFYTTKPPGAGTGLGLSISCDIVKKHRGDIQVQSIPGVGTTFTLSLPVSA